MNHLTLKQAEELIELLCRADRVCEFVENCEYMTRDSFRGELIWKAIFEEDFELAERHVSRLTNLQVLKMC